MKSLIILRKFLLLPVVLFVLSHGSLLGQRSEMPGTFSSDERATGIKVFDFEGFRPYLNKESDTLYIINFWATWCKPCIKELPYFERITKEFGDSPVRVILVSLDFPTQINTRLLPFIEEHELKSEVIVLHDPDANSWINKVSEEWSGAIPATLFYLAGNRDFYEKSFTYEELIKAVKQNLKTL